MLMSRLAAYSDNHCGREKKQRILRDESCLPPYGGPHLLNLKKMGKEY
jgi:hypothetical protein